MPAARTDVDAAAMYARYEEGLTLREVGEVFGVGKSTVHAAFSSLGLVLRPRGRPGGPPEERLARDRAASHARHVTIYTRHKARLDALKLASGCVDCGYRAHPAALQWDHVDPASKTITGSFASNAGRAWAWIEAEMAKCVVRCANCHAVRTATEGHAQKVTPAAG